MRGRNGDVDGGGGGGGENRWKGEECAFWGWLWRSSGLVLFERNWEASSSVKRVGVRRLSQYSISDLEGGGCE